MKILVTGGTVFVSKSIAEYFIGKGDEVYVLNRNTRPQPEGARLIEADRLNPGKKLKGMYFDAVFDATPYTAGDIDCLLNGIGGFGVYIMISTSAVYPETLKKPYKETDICGDNKFWGLYGSNKIKAEKTLLERVPGAYILRPSYIYGEGNNLYRESFVFDCADKNLPFYLPENCDLKLQFSYIGDLCRLISAVAEKLPENHIFNVGDIPVTAEDWVRAGYAACGKSPKIIRVPAEFKLHKYFPFLNYSSEMDVTRQNSLLNNLMPLEEGLKRSRGWYQKYGDGTVRKKDYRGFIEQNFEV